MSIAYLLDRSDRLTRVMTRYAGPPAAIDAGPDEVLNLSPGLLRELRQALRTIRYGAVELVIHDGRVVQLERREKIRFDAEVREHRR
jgi:hypothetical protein